MTKWLIKLRNKLVEGRLLTGAVRKLAKMAQSALKHPDYALGFAVRKLVFARGRVERNKILFMTYDNRFTCNPSYIARELLRRDADLDLVWVAPEKGNDRTGFPEEIRTVRRGSYEMFAEMATAKVWIDNALNCVWYGMPKKKEQIYINTWHGSLGIKRLSGGKLWMHRARRCRRATDYCIANSAFEEQVYRETFWPETPYLQYGHARNDIFFDPRARDAAREKVCSGLGIRPDQKILLYAPTFRDNGSGDGFDLDYERLKQAMEKRFGGDWVILHRFHFKNRARHTNMAYGDWLKDASLYPDMQELLVAADAGVTDYSSWAYDFILNCRPLFIYASDLEAYDQARGFYYPLESTPFFVARDNDELERGVESFDETAYAGGVARFLQEKGCYEDGQASVRAADKILELIRA